MFTDVNLAQYEVVIFLSTTGDVLNTAEQGAFERYIQAGGGYAGIHSASDTEYDWPWYGSLVGAYFNNHPAGTPTATVKIEDPVHPSTGAPAARWHAHRRVVQLPHPQHPPDPHKVHVLPSLDESTYHPGRHHGRGPPDHLVPGLRRWPLLVHRPGPHAGVLQRRRSFLQHILGGIETAAGVVDADCSATLSPASRRSRSTRARPTRWSSTSPPTAGSSTSTAPARCRSSCRATAASSRPAPPRLHGPGVRPAGHRARPELRARTTTCSSTTHPGRRVDRPRLAVHDERQHDRPVDRGDDPRGPRAARRVLPRGWVDGVRQQGQPLHRHR